MYSKLSGSITKWCARRKGGEEVYVHVSGVIARMSQSDSLGLS